MIAHARVAVSGDRLVRLRSAPPLALRSTPEALYLVGAAAGPMGGDELTIEIDVTDGADLTVRTSAASVVLPGPAPSRVTMRVRVEDGCSLRWKPEPTVLVRGCHHRVDARIELAATARLEWWEELVLGRHAEAAGSVFSRLVANLGGQPLLRHELALGPDFPESAGPAVAGGARVVGSVVVVDPSWADGDARPGASSLGIVVVLPLSGPAVQLLALGDDRGSELAALERAMASVRRH